MFWIEENPTSAEDNDSDVPFDECPGKPMACEQEIELVINPDDDLYPLKALDVDEDTWPETLSAYGGTSSTLVSDEVDKEDSIVKDNHSSDTQDSSEAEAEDIVSVALEPVDDDATQVMGEHHTIEGPEDERTLTSAQDNSFVYLAYSKSPSEPPLEATTTPLPTNDDSAAEGLEDTPAEDAASSSEEPNQDTEVLMEAPADSVVEPAVPQQAAAAAAAGTTVDPTVAVVEDEADENDAAPALVSEPAVVVDDSENDVASTTASETKPLNEMAAAEQDDNDDVNTNASPELDWYDQWEALEETDEDGISCISNMFASIKSNSNPTPPTPPTTESVEVPVSLLANPTMTTVFSDASESQFARCALTMKSEPPLQQQQDACNNTAPAELLRQQETTSATTSVSSEEGDEDYSSTSSSASPPKMRKQVILVFEGFEDDDNTNTEHLPPMTLTEFLNANCMQGTRKERRKCIMDRQKSAFSRITPVITSSSSAPGGYYDTAGAGQGLLEQFMDFDPLGQLQNMFGLAE